MFDISWQEFVFAAGNLVFIIGLLPSIFSQNKPAFWTSATAAPTLTAFAVAFFSLEFYFSAIVVSFGALGWYTLAIQKFLGNRKKSIDTSER